jgi:hypothetical protein
MQHVILESSPLWIVVCLAAGIGYAYLLYTTRYPWSQRMNYLLFGFRAVLVSALAFLLLGPIVRQVVNQFEKPVFAFVYDNSASVQAVTDSARLQTLQSQLQQARERLEEKGFEAIMVDLQGNEMAATQTTLAESDLQGALRQLAIRMEGKNLAGVLLASDGVYNRGLSPLYSAYSFPVHTLGLGDTLQRPDILIKDVHYNKIAYQGNKFTLRADILVKKFEGQPLTISLMHKGKVLARQVQDAPSNAMLTVDFQPAADEQGIQRYDVVVEEKAGEFNTQNNRATVFIEVVEGKKKILLVAPAPHPDIKALRAVIEQHANYDLIVHIPGVEDAAPANLQPAAVDMVIFHQSPDLRGRTRDVYTRFSAAALPMFIIYGQQTDLTVLQKDNLPVKFEQAPRQYDEVTPVINPAFQRFTLSTETNSAFATFPPASVHFGKMQMPPTAIPLLYQRVGSLTTNKPLLTVMEEGERKIAVMLADGMWRWRLHEFSKFEKTDAFDEVFGKLIQYLGTNTDKSRFRSYPVEQEFSETEPVVFESQVYNDIFEPVYGNAIDLEITDEQGKRTEYRYVISPNGTRYQIGGLAEGVYRYRSSTDVNGKKIDVRGQFLVTAQQVELQNLTADFGLLRKLSAQTGGQFENQNNLAALVSRLEQQEAVQTIRSSETFDSLVNLKWVFFLLLLLVSAEWFLRKFHGSY